MNSQSLKGRVAVVTGASRGIGYFTAKQLAKKGAHVIAVARTVGGLEELDDEIQSAGGSTTLVPFDLTDFDAIDRLGQAIFDRWGKLDILVGNAGVLGPISPLGHVEPKAFEDLIAVNITANWRLIRSLDPLLRLSDAGRAVFLTSGAPHKCRAYWGPYSMSKAALEALVRTYVNETQKTNMKSMLINPGPMRTAMRAKAMPGEDPEKLPHPSELSEIIVQFCQPISEENGRLYDYPSRTLCDFVQITS